MIPELNLVGSQASASNAAGLLDMGQLMGNKQFRVGGRLLLSLRCRQA